MVFLREKRITVKLLERLDYSPFYLQTKLLIDDLQTVKIMLHEGGFPLVSVGALLPPPHPLTDAGKITENIF